MGFGGNRLSLDMVKSMYATVRVDEMGRLHSVDRKPAVEFQDGRVEYHWHGIRVDDEVIKNPQSITVSRIDAEGNSEIKRILIELYGQQRYFSDCGAVLLKRDGVGELYQKQRRGDRPIRFVKVKNSTLEPDGTRKDYFLRVPPETKTPREGIAWTFNVHPKHYQPEVET